MKKEPVEDCHSAGNRTLCVFWILFKAERSKQRLANLVEVYGNCSSLVRAP